MTGDVGDTGGVPQLFILCLDGEHPPDPRINGGDGSLLGDAAAAPHRGEQRGAGAAPPPPLPSGLSISVSLPHGQAAAPASRGEEEGQPPARPRPSYPRAFIWGGGTAADVYTRTFSLVRLLPEKGPVSVYDRRRSPRYYYYYYYLKAGVVPQRTRWGGQAATGPRWPRLQRAKKMESGCLETPVWRHRENVGRNFSPPAHGASVHTSNRLPRFS